jgi:hypothetical protein
MKFNTQFRFRFSFVLLVGFLALQSSLLFAQETKKPDPATTTVTAVAKDSAADQKTDLGTAPDQAAIDNLTKYLEGSKWKGTFTMRDREGALLAEEYEITSAKKEPTGDQWVLVARIKYMERDVKVPVPLSIMWLDRTPVIVLDQITIPGMGTFDARVIIRKGMYAGTWAHGKVGGHMFGNIKIAAQQKSESDSSSDSKPKEK